MATSMSSASAKNRDANHYRVESDSGQNPKASSAADRIEVARTEYEAIRLYLRDLPQEPPNYRASTREKLAKLTRCQFRELSMDVYDEVVRRNESRKGGGVSFLAARDDFHPKRNLARQKLSTLPPRRFNDLSSDVSYDLGRRYPEITEPDVKKSDDLPRVPNSPPPAYEPQTPQIVVEDEPPHQSYLLRFVKKFGSLFGC